MRTDFNQAMAQSFVLLEKAETILQARWKATRDDWKLGLKLAETLRQMGQHEQAMQLYAEVLKLNPECRQANYMFSVLSGNKVVKPNELDIVPVPFVFVHQVPSDHELGVVWECIFQRKDRFTQSYVSDRIDLKTRNSKVVYDEELLDIKELVQLRSAAVLASAWGRLNIDPFKIAKTEIQLTRHSNGEFYNIHKDAGSEERTANRAVTYVLYLFQEPAKFEGGNLLLYDYDTEKKGITSKFTRIVPRNNSTVLFPSKAWHQVTPVSCANEEFEYGRFTINGWWHRIL